MADPPKQSQSQVDKFRDLARELECDEERFEEAVRGVAKSTPQRQPKPAEKKP